MEAPIVVSSIFVVLLLVFAKNNAARNTCAILALPLSSVCVMVSFVLGVHLFVTSVAVFLIQVITPKVRYYVATVLLATLLVYGRAFQSAWERHLEHEQVREAFPIQSVEERLAYENGVQRIRDGLAFSEESLRDMEVALSDDEKAYLRQHHRYALERLHNGTLNAFIDSPGFGSGRMVSPGIRNIILPKDDPIPLPASSSHPLSAEGFQQAVTPLSHMERDRLKEMMPRSELSMLHFKSSLDFLDPTFFGVVKSRSEVLGFVPHHFQKMPKLDTWEVELLELVSLLRHKEPVAYVSANLPRMKELKNAPTRPLTAFEKLGLERLKKGDELHVDYAPRMTRMVGSIRAAKQCLECHDAKRGELLGAFSYRLGK